MGQRGSANLAQRVNRAAQAALDDHDCVTAIDVLLRLGWLAPPAVDRWRQGRVDCLEDVVEVDVHKISAALRLLEDWARANGLEPHETSYVARTRDRRPLWFSQRREAAVEQACRTHWISPALPPGKRTRLAERQSRPPDLLQEARAAHRRRDWPRAYELFAALDDRGALAPEDLDALSDAAWWLGRVEEFLAAGEAAFTGHLDHDRPLAAAMTALGMAVSLFLRGDEVLGSGWLARAQRLVQEVPDSVEHGRVRYVMEVEGGLDGDDLEAVVSAARDLQRLGRRHGDASLVASGIVGEGRALVRLGQVDRGLRLLDEAMVTVLHDDLEPEWAGNIYCHLMAACHELADIRRARDWTDATTRWLAQLSAAVLFTGICRVHRSQVLQITGQWEEAEQEATRVLHDLADLHVGSVAEAHYQVGELRRLRGDHEGAEEAYSRARAAGRDPQPGLALLHLAAGRAAAAQAGISAALHAAGTDRLARARLCGAQVHIALAAGDQEAAAHACAELEAAAATYQTSGLEAAALHWRGALALAEGRAEEALPALRAACRRWHEVHAAHDAARSRVLLGRAYHALGDHVAATAELATAHETFARLGATTDAQAAAAMTRTRSLPGGLTEREAEVLALVAGGKTNRQVADALVVSQKTVARHLSNIFTKLGVSTRTEAAAFAFQQGLADPGVAGRRDQPEPPRHG